MWGDEGKGKVTDYLAQNRCWRSLCWR
ncbi:MAG: hypothetical protein ACLS7Y_05300 [Thomasclavelia spiroformis]